MTLSQLSEKLGVSSFHLQRTFKKALGISPRQYAAERRANKFKTSVRDGQAIASAMYDAGYGSSSRLYERSTVEFGMTPATYRRNGAGAKITFAVAECELGWLLVAATEKGICAVRLGANANELELGLRNEFSAAQINPDTGDLSKSVKQILEHLEGIRPDLNLPLDVQATAFQRLVWEALVAIPYGATKSYGEVAKAIGRPSAVRAVARACATNPVALVVPCHRVIGSNKNLSGYRWGIERKKKLLQREQKAITTRTKE
jgi:AraC family transcriptional regulator of adaptative response/methylated-DNA-[protein]-cysteine methyltransferase